jgi:hypothetical protein
VPWLTPPPTRQRIVVGPDVDGCETDIAPAFKFELVEQVVGLVKRGASAI